MIQVNAMKALNGPGVVETLVDNEIAVQNLTKMAGQKNCAVKSEKLAVGTVTNMYTIVEKLSGAGKVVRP